MGFDLNQVILIGKTIEEILIREFENSSVGSVRMVTNQTWKDRLTGERKEEAAFHNVSIWNPYLLKDLKNAGLKKGCGLLIVGYLRNDSWLDAEGNRKQVVRITVRGPSCTARVLTSTFPPIGRSSDALDDLPPF